MTASWGRSGEEAWFEDQPLDEHRHGGDGVRVHYEELIGGLPDLRIDIRRRYVTEDHVILEVTVSGTHIGTWRGLPGTGNEVEFPA